MNAKTPNSQPTGKLNLPIPESKIDGLYRMGYVNRKTHRITYVSGADTLSRVQTMIAKYRGCYSPVVFVTVVASDAEPGDKIPGLENIGTVKGNTY